MRSLPKPNLDADDVYATCISNFRAPLRSRLSSIAHRIKAGAGMYEVAGGALDFHTLARNGTVGGVTKEELQKIYVQKMAGEKGPGRKFYDELRSSVQNDLCPLCSKRQITTLDHYLPKTKYSLFAVLPLNLVPACSDCNKRKLEFWPANKENQMFHPYYDVLPDEVWLRAHVVEVTPAVVTYAVVPPATWSTDLGARVRFHFKTLRLGSLYSNEAGTEMNDIRHKISKLHSAGGPAAVRAHLEEDWESSSVENPNSWSAALYRALADSTWYCSGGFR